MCRYFTTGLLVLAAAAPLSAITIDLQDDGSLTARDLQGLVAAKSFWETRLTGYGTDYGFTGPTIFVSAGVFTPTVGGYVTVTAGAEGGVFTAQEGVLEINAGSVAALDAAGAYDASLIRAMGHALGFGHYGMPDRLWNVNGLAASSSAYSGAYALAAYRTEFSQPGAGSISLASAPDSALGWNQAVLANDLLAATPTSLATATLSATSLAAFRDLGYTVIPEPAEWAAVGGVSALVLAIRRRRRR